MANQAAAEQAAAGKTAIKKAAWSRVSGRAVGWQPTRSSRSARTDPRPGRAIFSFGKFDFLAKKWVQLEGGGVKPPSRL